MTRPSSRAAAVRGFSLIEVLVAFAIMAMALGVLYRGMGGGIRDVGKLEQRQRATLLAQSLLNAQGMLLPDDVGSAGTEAGMSWRVVIAPYPTETQAARPAATPLRSVTVTVGWQEAGELRQMELRTLRPERKPPAGGAGG